jgi:hypothetical protein
MKRLLVPVKLLFILCLMILVATGAIGVAGANGTSGAAKTPKPLLDAVHSFRSPISQPVTANPGDDDEASVPVQGGSWVYTVKRGDSLYSIAQRFGFTVEKLRSYNGLSSNNLRIGQRLTIPPASQAQKSNALASGDVDMLARLIHAEAQAEPYTGKVAVGAVVLNRTRAPGFPNTVAGVIYQPLAFESVSNGWFYRAAATTSYQAARAAISGWDPTGGAIYFFNPAKTRNRFIWSRKIVLRIGNHVFAI